VIVVLMLLNFSGGLAPEASSATAFESRQGTNSVAGITYSNSRNQDVVSRSVSGNTARNQAQESPREVVNDFRLPSVETLPARNIETRTALLRGEVDLRDYKRGTAFFVYGYNETKVQALAKDSSALSHNSNQINDEARVIVTDLNTRGEESYQRSVGNLVEDLDYSYLLCVEFTALSNDKEIVCGETKSFSTNPSFSANNNFSTPRISSGRVINVTDSSADLTSRLDMMDGKEGTAFVVYGESRDMVSEVSTFDSYRDVDEDDEDLQKIRLGRALFGQSNFTITLKDLDNDRLHYFRMCVEYDGERDGLVCERTNSFTTDSRDRSDKPAVSTSQAQTSSRSVTLSGDLRMRDFIDGYAFFVYGTDLELVKGVDDANSFGRIRQQLDRLQKVAVDADADGNQSYQIKVRDLEDSGIYHYQLCVQYVDQDQNNREVFVIGCGGVRSFANI